MNTHSLNHLALSDNGFLFDTTTGFTYTLNKIGTEILKGLIGDKDMDTIIDHILDNYDTTFDIVSREAELFVSHLRELGLIPDQD